MVEIKKKENKYNAYEVSWLVSAPICLPSRNFNNVVDWVLFSSLDCTISVRLRFGGSSSFDESFFFFVFLTTSLAAFLRLVSIVVVVVVVRSSPIFAAATRDGGDNVDESDGSSNRLLLVHFSNALDLHALLFVLLRLLLLEVDFDCCCCCWLTIELESSLRSGFIILFARTPHYLSLSLALPLALFTLSFDFFLLFYSVF